MCNTSRKDDSKPYNFGGLGKCMEDGEAAKLQKCLLVGQGTEDSRFKLANDRLRVLMADAHDVFTSDILYHKKCYSSYLTQIRKKPYSQEETQVQNEGKEWEVNVMKIFLELFRKKVLIDRNGYLMTELIQDIHEVSLENGLEDAMIKHTHLFKKRLVEEFGNSIGFYIVGKNGLFTAR